VCEYAAILRNAVSSMLFLGGLALTQAQTVRAQSDGLAGAKPELKSGTASAGLTALPRPPKGKSTILGGAIGNVDPVLDRFSLKVYGQHPMTIVFDERTQVYRDGVRIPLRNLGPEDHASVQTVLDGTNVFALSVHILSQAPEGDYQGHVLSYNPRTGELTVLSMMDPKPIRLLVPPNTPIERVGETTFTSLQSGPSDLVRGSLISIKFESGKEGQGTARRIDILAVPGSAFVFGGSIATLDLHSGLLVVVDPRDGKGYQIFFESGRFPTAQNLHPGQDVTVTASYDGTKYVASDIRVN
jgi:hypothetical protein